jgi:hypothetical protein
MKATVRGVDDHGTHYTALMFACQGCMEFGGTGLHMLPVNTPGLSKPTWQWDGNLEAPTLNPSILSKRAEDQVCHSFLHNGEFQFLGDCTHSLAGQTVPMIDLPDWAAELQ